MGIGSTVSADFNYDILLRLQKIHSKIQFDYARLYIEQKVDGMILVFPKSESPAVKELEEKNVPAVLIDGVSDTLDYIHLIFTNFIRNIIPNILIIIGKVHNGEDGIRIIGENIGEIKKKS